MTLRNNAGQSSGELSEYQDPPVVTAAPLSPHRSHSFLTRIEDKAATDGYKHGMGEEVCEQLAHCVLVAVPGFPQLLAVILDSGRADCIGRTLLAIQVAA